MNPLIETVRIIWEGRGIRNYSTATEADILTFEKKYAVTLAPIVRDYFFKLNGTNIGQCGMEDEHLMGFWHLDQVRPLEEECPEYGTSDEPNLFVFADYSIWALGFAIRLAAVEDKTTAVFLVGGRDPLVNIAPNFENFLQRYSVGDPSLLP